jgi:hypothetical protein
MGIGVRLAAGTLALAFCVSMADGAPEVPENCRSIAERYAHHPGHATPRAVAALEACLAAGRSDSPQPTASPSAPAWPSRRASEESLPVEPWAHTSASWSQPQPW